MSESTETKICPLCAETIKAAAKICPFCGTRQGVKCSSRSDIVQIVCGFVFAGIGAGIFIWLWPQDRLYGRNFSRHRQELQVIRTSLGHEHGQYDFWLTGYVTNQAEHPWRVRELEVRFLDARSNLLDATQVVIKDDFAVQPHQEHAFRVGIRSLAVTDDGIARQVRVQNATDENRTFEPEPD